MRAGHRVPGAEAEAVAAVAAVAGADEAGPAGRAVDPVVSVRGLRMSYGSTDVLVGVDLDVHAGEVVCLLGPNGAGKTTTIEILEGFRLPSAGEVRVFGVDPARGGDAWRARIGVVLQSWRDHARWTPRRLLDHLGAVGFVVHPINLWRVAGAVLLILGVEDLPRRHTHDPRRDAFLCEQIPGLKGNGDLRAGGDEDGLGLAAGCVRVSQNVGSAEGAPGRAWVKDGYILAG